MGRHKRIVNSPIESISEVHENIKPTKEKKVKSVIIEESPKEPKKRGRKSVVKTEETQSQPEENQINEDKSDIIFDACHPCDAVKIIDEVNYEKMEVPTLTKVHSFGNIMMNKNNHIKKNIEESIINFSNHKTYYIYVKCNYQNKYLNSEIVSESNLLKYIHFLNINIYPRNNNIDSNILMVTEEDRDDLVYEDEYELKLKSNNIIDFNNHTTRNIKIMIRMVKNKIDVKEIENDKWQLYFLQYKHDKFNLTLHEVLQKVLNKESWKYVMTNDNIHLMLEKTHRIDNTYALSKSFKLVVEEDSNNDKKHIIYSLGLTFRDVIMRIIE